MTEQQIKELIEAQGFSMRTVERVSTRGDGTMFAQISMSCTGLKRPVYVGAMSKLAEMSEADLVSLIETKAAQVLQRLAQQKHENKEHKAGKAIVLKARNW